MGAQKLHHDTQAASNSKPGSHGEFPWMTDQIVGSVSRYHPLPVALHWALALIFIPALPAALFVLVTTRYLRKCWKQWLRTG